MLTSSSPGQSHKPPSVPHPLTAVCLILPFLLKQPKALLPFNYLAASLLNSLLLSNTTGD